MDAPETHHFALEFLGILLRQEDATVLEDATLTNESMCTHALNIALHAIQLIQAQLPRQHQTLHVRQVDLLVQPHRAVLLHHVPEAPQL